MVFKKEWDLGLLVPDISESSIKKIQKSLTDRVRVFVSKWKNRTDYLNEPAILKEALDEYEKLSRTSDDEGGALRFYVHLESSKKQTDNSVKARYNLVDDWATKLENEIRFFPLSVSRVPVKKQKEFLSNSALSGYRHFLERKFKQSPYLLSNEVENVINLKSKTSNGNWVKMVSEFLSKEEKDLTLADGTKVKKNFSEIVSLLSDSNKKVRDQAAVLLNEILLKNLDSAEAEINSVFADKKINDELRKTPRPDTLRHIMDDIETESVDTLVKTVSQRFDIAKRYYKLKAELMGVKKLAYHERNVQYGDLDKKLTFDEAVKIVNESFKSLDPIFSEYFISSLNKGLVDVFPGKGKRGGAFCSWYGNSLPVYVLLNHTDKITDALTIAHEFGHSINAELSKKQNALQFSTPTSTTEVASTFMEDFVLQELEKGASEELKLALMTAKLNDDVSTIFRQIACYKFEQELHKTFREKGHLSKEEIGAIFLKNMEAYMGPAVEQSPGSENWWVYWSHIRNFFYVYSYASGLLISKALQSQVKKDPKFIGKVREFLSSGNSASPKEIFGKIGIDITKKEFWESGLDEVENLLNETEKLARKLGKI